MELSLDNSTLTKDEKKTIKRVQDQYMVREYFYRNLEVKRKELEKKDSRFGYYHSIAYLKDGTDEEIAKLILQDIENETAAKKCKQEEKEIENNDSSV